MAKRILSDKEMAEKHGVVSGEEATARAFIDKTTNNEKTNDSIQETTSPLDFIPYESLALPVGKAVARGVVDEFGHIVGNEVGTLGSFTPKVVSPENKEVVEAIKNKKLSFFNPDNKEIFDSHIVDQNAAGDIRGVLGLDKDQVVQSIKVDPASRGQGVASGLYKKALDEHGVIRSSPKEMQLEGGKGLWEKFQEENPLNVKQARNPHDLKPWDYKVWESEKTTNVPLRQQEIKLENEIDMIRSLLKDTSKLPKDDIASMKQTLAELISQHKAVNKQSGHTLFADGGEVPDFISDSEISSPTPKSSSAPDFIPDGDFKSDEDVYGTPGQMAITALESGAKGLIGPLAPLAETTLGVDPENIRLREETNPTTHIVSEIGGLVAPALATLGSSAAARVGLSGVAEAIPTIAKFTQAGALEAIQSRLALTAGESLASKIGTGAAKAAIDNMLIAGSDETSKMIIHNPEQSVQTALLSVGLAGVLGGALGGGASAGEALWKATVGSKAGKLTEDFRAAIQHHMDNPNPVEGMTKELTDYHNTISGMADEVYGVTGLKAQDVAKAVPETMTPKIFEQAQSISNKVEDQVSKMMRKIDSYPARLVSKLQGDLEGFQSAVSKENLTPVDVFNATQDLKQTLQSYAKYDKFVKPVDEAYDFVRDSKSLAHSLRESLEDKAVWGKAAERQQQINKAFKEYLPTLEDFQKKFMTEVSGEKVIDPGKINTYLNQLGKPSAEIKSTMLDNFLKASERYKKVIQDTHTNLGIEGPAFDSPMNITMASLEKPTLGGKLAQIFINKGLTDAGSSTLGAGVGAAMGSVAGAHGATLGAIVGHHALGPFFKSVLPAIAKSLLDNKGTPQGFKAAVDYSLQVAKGEQLLNRATQNVFKAGAEVLSPHFLPTAKDRAKLDKYLQVAQQDPEKLGDGDTSLASYMPDHTSALAGTSMNAVNYLNSLRPNTERMAPLDSPVVVNSVQKAKYENALNIAQQPLLILDKVKRGNLTQSDIETFGALYPQLAQSISSKLLSDMTTHIAKGHNIPYKTRMSLSMLLAQPMDSTMAPMAIQSIQGSLNANGSGRGPAAAQGTPKSGSGGTKSSPALQKMPQLYSTPNQAKELHRNKP